MTGKTSKTIFLAGCGGGYDIFGGLPYYFKIKSNGIDDVALIHYTFTKHTHLSQYSQQLTRVLFRIDPTTDIAWLTDNVYFPEQRLANELHVSIYAILCDYVETRIELIVEAYRYFNRFWMTIAVRDCHHNTPNQTKRENPYFSARTQISNDCSTQKHEHILIQNSQVFLKASDGSFM